MKYIILLTLSFFSTFAFEPDWILKAENQPLVHAFKTIPIQEGGRIKPLDTYARFLLLRMHGTQSLKLSEPLKTQLKFSKLSAIQWLLLTWLDPVLAQQLPTFRVDNSAIVGEINVEPKNSDESRGLQAHYSFNEILPGKDQLLKRYSELIDKDTKSLTSNEKALLDLARNFSDYDAVLNFMTAARTDWNQAFTSILSPASQTLIIPKENASMWDIANQLGKVIRDQQAQSLLSSERDQVLQLFIDKALRPAKSLVFIPPAKQDDPAWLHLDDILTKLMRDGVSNSPEIELAKAKDTLVYAKDFPQFQQASQLWINNIRNQAQARNELQYIDLEVNYHQKDYFYNALVIDILIFLLALISIAIGSNNFTRYLRYFLWTACLCALYYHISGITIRCIINQRPPVATLYETIIFISAILSICCLFIERIYKLNFGFLLLGLLGSLGMFLAHRFMELDSRDTMPTLEAVLITNFWLATHVIIINIGYAGSLLASFLSMLYVIYRDIGRHPEMMLSMRKILTRLTYGIICFALLFSLVGTVLGGIWANDSWGRFWGWDPKENGALMIVLMQLIILHARLGGYIREVGLHALSLMLGIITLFSWFGVNMLSVGLHTYGFIDGISLALTIGYACKACFILNCFLFYRIDKKNDCVKLKT